MAHNRLKRSTESQITARVAELPALKRNTRPADVISVVGDGNKARQFLNWSPTVSFELMVKKMVEFDLESIDVGDLKRIWKPE
jgi:GDP-D-mannose dehydratase